jgi:multimeric flavodoxin WrbA
MKVTILNGNPDNSSSYFNAYINDFQSILKLKGFTVKTFHLHEMDIKSCTGCWGCWVKTPGECNIPDDSIEVRNSVINSDWLVFASPLIMGYTSALLKIMQDKLIPLLHPYFELVNDECHHKSRYEKYPKIGLIYSKEPDTDHEDIKIVKNIYKRMALNFKSELVFAESIEYKPEKLTHEIVLN